MHGQVQDWPTRILVHSEEDDNEAYLVELTEWELGLNEQGTMTFNGSCQCKDFIYRCEPRLKRDENMGKVFRCKHIKWARDHALEIMLPKLKALDKNIPDSQQP